MPGQPGSASQLALHEAKGSTVRAAQSAAQFELQNWLFNALHATGTTCVVHPTAPPVLVTLVHLTQLSATPPQAPTVMPGQPGSASQLALHEAKGSSVRAAQSAAQFEVQNWSFRAFHAPGLTCVVHPVPKFVLATLLHLTQLSATPPLAPTVMPVQLESASQLALHEAKGSTVRAAQAVAQSVLHHWLFSALHVVSSVPIHNFQPVAVTM
jgi:hypothetical protein